MFGHHEDKCPADSGSVCANCGADSESHHTSACKNSAKCVNCGKTHVSRSNQCEIWKKEKEIMKIKVTKNITYLEAKKVLESQPTDLDFSKIVHSLSSKPESKSTGTQFSESVFTINPSSKIITPSIKPKSTSVPQSQSSSQSIQDLGQVRLILTLNLVQSLAHSPVLSHIHSLVLSRSRKK